MSNLEIVFKEISKNKIKLAASPNGATFEENFKQYLRKYGFNEISKNTMDEMNEFFEDFKRPKTPAYAVFQADDADCVVIICE